MDFLIELQRAIHSGLSAEVSGFAADRNWGALLATFPLGIVFGAAHGLTPGHSKLVLATYVLGSGGGAARAFFTAAVLTITHILSAVVIAMALNWLVSRTITSAGQAPAVEWASRLLLVLIGLWLLARATLQKPHLHGEGMAFGFIAGLIPCPLTLFMMFYAMSLGIPEAGLVFAVAMLVGVGVVLVLVALTSVFARRWVTGLSGFSGAPFEWVSRAIDIAAGGMLITIAAVQLAS